MPSALVGGTVIACTVCLLVARNVGLHRGGLLGLGAGVLIGFFGVTVVWGSDRAARHPGLLSLVIGAGIAAGSVIVLEVTAPKAQGTSARRPHYTWIWAISGLALFVAVLPYAAISQLPYLGVGPPFLTMADVAFGLTLGSVGMTLFTLAAPQRQKSADLVVAGMGLLLAMSGIVATGVLVQMDAGPAGIYRRSALQLADITAAGGFVLVAVAAGLRAGRQRRPAHPVVTATLGNVT
jgi:hypothetical protein